MIGLHYVEELMPETNRDAYPPHYACGLCNVAAAPATRDGERLDHFLPVKSTDIYLEIPSHSELFLEAGSRNLFAILPNVLPVSSATIPLVPNSTSDRKCVAAVSACSRT